MYLGAYLVPGFFQAVKALQPFLNSVDCLSNIVDDSVQHLAVVGIETVQHCAFQALAPPLQVIPIIHHFLH
jgi:hypothetical protein